MVGRRFVALPLVLAACTGDGGLTARNAPPAAEITSPGDGRAVDEGASVTLRGQASDPDDASVELVADFTVDGEIACASLTPSDDGAVACDVVLPAGDVTIGLEVTDPGGSAASDHVTVTVIATDAPSAEILAPESGAVLAPGETVELRGFVSDGEDAASALEVWWEDSRGDTIDDVSVDGDGFVSSWAALSSGEHVLSLHVRDTSGKEGAASVAFRVNTPPAAPVVALSPNPSDTSDDLVATLTTPSTDADGDAVTYTWAWTVDGVAHTHADATLPAADTTRGETWTVTVTPNDGYGDGASATATLTIGNAIPVITDVSVTDPLVAGDVAACTATGFGDADGDPDLSTYAWDVGGVPAGTGALLSSGFARGDGVTCEVTPHDGIDAGTPRSASVTVGNAPPSLAYAEIAPDPVQAGDTLTCSGAGWSDADGDADRSTIAWAVNGVAAGTGATYSGGFVDGDTVTCTITPYDGYDTGAPVTTSVTVSASAPSITSVSITPDPAYAADTLTCGWSGYVDPDGDADQSTVAWTVDGAAAGTGTTLAGAFVYGDVVVCTVTPYDGTATGTPKSASITIANTPPEALDATLTPSPAYEGDTLVCTPGTIVDDDGATTFVYRYGWSVSGSDPGPTTSTLSSAYFRRGDSVTCTVTPYDGADWGTGATSGAVTIGNTAPAIASVSLAPTTVYTDTTVTAVVSASDADGDTVTLSYAWAIDGAPIAATGATLSGAWFDKGDVITVTVTPSDGTDSGSAVASAGATVANSAPVAPVVAIDPASPEEGVDDLWCEITTAGTDADGDAITYVASWTRNGAAYTGALTTTWTDDTVPFSDTTRRDAFVCTMTPSDGATSGAAGTATAHVRGPEIDWGNTQWPCSTSASAGATFNVYGWVYHAGITDSAGQGVGITAEAGVGPDGSDPETDTGWTWTATSYNGDKDGASALANDEYWGILTAPSASGSYDYAWRYSTDGGLSWKYADLGGSCGGRGTDDGYDPSTAGALTVP